MRSSMSMQQRYHNRYCPVIYKRSWNLLTQVQTNIGYLIDKQHGHQPKKIEFLKKNERKNN